MSGENMKVLDPGFVKRNDPPEKFPGNENAYPGTQMQDVLRVLIDRCKYVNNQKFCPETDVAITFLRQAIWVLESRARRVRGEEPLPFEGVVGRVEDIPVCPDCGHLFCLVGQHNEPYLL